MKKTVIYIDRIIDCILHIESHLWWMSLADFEKDRKSFSACTMELVNYDLPLLKKLLEDYKEIL